MNPVPVQKTGVEVLTEIEEVEAMEGVGAAGAGDRVAADNGDTKKLMSDKGHTKSGYPRL